MLIVCVLSFLFLLCCFLLLFSKLKKREKKYDEKIPQTLRNQSALDCEILDEIRRDIDDDNDEEPEVVITDLAQIISSLSPRSASVLSSSSSSSPGSLPSSRSSTASTTRLLVTPSPAASPLGTDWRQMWDSSGNWSSYADDRAFWTTRPSQPPDPSYSSVDWIIKDIMTSYPSLERVNREQALRKIKLDLTSALLQLKTTKLGGCNLIAQHELENIEIIKKQYDANIERFLIDFKDELGDDDISNWRNEMDDVSVKVKSAQDDIRRQPEILDYQSMILDPKGTKLETILEMCQEIDNASGKDEIQVPVEAEEMEMFDDETEIRSSVPLPRLEGPRKEERRGKTVVSYSVQQQVTQTMTVTQE